MECQTGAAGTHRYIGDKPMTTRDRLESFKDLKDGWTPEGGLAPDHAGLDWLADEFEKHYPDDLEAPVTVPTPDGEVAFLWIDGDDERGELEVDLKRHTATWCVFVPDGAGIDVWRENLVMESPHFWPWVAGQVRELLDTFKK